MGHSEDSVRDHDDLVASVRAAVATERESSAEPQRYELPQHEPEPAEHAPDEAQLQEQQPERKQTRDGRGRFASASASGAAEPADQQRPPTSWSEQAKSEWEKLIPELREAVLKRESEIQNGQRQYQDERQQFRDIQTALEPYRESFQRHGHATYASAVQHLAGLSDFFEKNPVGATAHVLSNSNLSQQQYLQIAANAMQRAGIDPRTLGQGGISQEQLEQHVQARIQAAMQEAGQRVDAYVKAQVQQQLAQARQNDQRLQSKIRAAGASMNGAPYGAGNGTPIRRSGGSQFDDIAGVVLDAIRSHS
jgi:hypothetical protein